ncbi:MAG: DNA polymerase III subunit delta [Gammaproteobacteria bacterium]|nr:DNA polymerase III subunit delta [Gammaproteobacteria bacterium]
MLLLKNLSPAFIFVLAKIFFLVNELSDTIIKVAKKQGFEHVTRFYIQSSGSWDEVSESLQHVSLFSPKVCLVVQLMSWKFDETVKTLLTKITQHTRKDLLLIIKGPKIERATTQTKWFQRMTEKGYWIDLPTISFMHMPEWIQRRASHLYGLILSHKHARFIAQRTENNLPQAAQIIDKLFLIQEDITDDILEVLVDTSAEYDAFKLMDACLLQDSARARVILLRLQYNDVEPLMIIGAFTREFRLLRELYQADPSSLKTVADRLGIWSSRLPMMQTFMRSHSSDTCQLFLAQLAYLDALAKGACSGNIWDKLLFFCAKISNKNPTLLDESTEFMVLFNSITTGGYPR